MLRQACTVASAVMPLLALVLCSAPAALSQKTGTTGLTYEDPGFGGDVYDKNWNKPKKSPPPPPIKISCNATMQNPPNRIIQCSVVSLLRVRACIRLMCSPMPPPACGTGNQAKMDPNAPCSWNVKRSCTSMYPVMPYTRWTFGYLDNNTNPIAFGFNGAGYSVATAGVYAC